MNIIKSNLLDALGLTMIAFVMALAILYGLEHDNALQNSTDRFRVQYSEQSNADYAMDVLNECKGDNAWTDSCLGCIDDCLEPAK